MTLLGSYLIDQIWPQLKSQGALSTATYRSITAGSITSTSIVSGTPSAGSTTSTTINMLLQDFRQMEIDGTQVVRGDRKARFPTSIISLTPDVDDQVDIGSDTYRVVNVRKPVDGASFELQLRAV